MNQADYYTYRITWSDEDGEYVALSAEFPSLSWLAGTPEDALAGMRALVSDVVQEMESVGEAVPEPLSRKRYSGKFQVRVTPECHRTLAIEAAEARVSLNRYVSDKLGR